MLEQLRTERFVVEWRVKTAIEPDTGEWNPDGDEYARKYYRDIDAAISTAKKCPFDQGPVHVRRMTLCDEIAGGENFGPRWEYDGSGVLVAVEGDEVVDYR